MDAQIIVLRTIIIYLIEYTKYYGSFIFIFKAIIPLDILSHNVLSLLNVLIKYIRKIKYGAPDLQILLQNYMHSIRFKILFCQVNIGINHIINFYHSLCNMVL